MTFCDIFAFPSHEEGLTASHSGRQIVTHRRCVATSLKNLLLLLLLLPVNVCCFLPNFHPAVPLQKTHTHKKSGARKRTS